MESDLSLTMGIPICGRGDEYPSGPWKPDKLPPVWRLDRIVGHMWQSRASTEAETTLNYFMHKLADIIAPSSPHPPNILVISSLQSDLPQDFQSVPGGGG